MYKMKGNRLTFDCAHCHGPVSIRLVVPQLTLSNNGVTVDVEIVDETKSKVRKPKVNEVTE